MLLLTELDFVTHLVGVIEFLLNLGVLEEFEELLVILVAFLVVLLLGEVDRDLVFNVV